MWTVSLLLLLLHVHATVSRVASNHTQSCSDFFTLREIQGMKTSQLLDFGENLGQIDIASCSVTCVRRKDCFMFHWSQLGECYLITKLNDFSKTRFESDASLKRMWVRNLTLNTNCLKQNFPHTLGWHRYDFQQTQTSWTKSLENCKQRGGILAEPRTREQQTFLSNIIRDIRGPTQDIHKQLVHIGLKQIKTKENTNLWVWNSNGDPLEGGSWDFGEPSSNTNGGLENFGALKTSTYLHNVGDEYQLSSICECYSFE